MPLDPQVAAYRAQRVADAVVPLYTQSLAEARAADLAAIQAGGGAVEPVHQVTDRSVPGPAGELPIRIYRPAGTGPRAVRPRQGQCRTGELYSGEATINVGGARCTKELALFHEGGILVLLVKVVVGLRLATDAVQS